MVETKLRITGDTRGASKSLEALNKDILQTSQGVGRFRGVLSALGGFAALQITGQLASQFVSFQDALSLVRGQLRMTDEEFSRFSRMMQGQARHAQSLGVGQDEFARVLLDSALAASKLAGDLDRVDAISTVLTHSLLMARAQNIGFGDSAGAVLRILKAYGFVAADANGLTDLLTTTFLETEHKATDLAGALDELGPSVVAFGEATGQGAKDTLAEVLAILGRMGPESSTAVGSLLGVLDAAARGDEKAKDFLETIGFVLSEDGGGVPPLLDALNAIHVTAGDGAGALDTMKAMVGELISDADLKRLIEYGDGLERIVDLEGKLHRSAGSTEAVVQAARPKTGVARFQEIRHSFLDAQALEREGASRVENIARRAAGEVNAAVIGGGIFAIEQLQTLGRTIMGAGTGRAPGTATGGVVTGPQVRLIGEAGPEAVVPFSHLAALGLGVDAPVDVARALGVPMLAAGGIVSRPTLALIGEAGPEAVVPLGRGGRDGRASRTIIIQNLNLPSVRSGRDFARQLEFEATYGKLGGE